MLRQASSCPCYACGPLRFLGEPQQSSVLTKYKNTSVNPLPGSEPRAAPGWDIHNSICVTRVASWDLGHLHHHTSALQSWVTSPESRGRARLTVKPLRGGLSASQDTALPKPHRVAVSSPEQDVCTPWCSGDASLLSPRCDIPGNHVPRASSQQSQVQRAREPWRGRRPSPGFSEGVGEQAAWASGCDTLVG